MSHISEQADNHKREDFIPANIWGCDVAISEQEVRQHLLEIKEKIAHCNVKIVAVTKYFGRNAIVAAYKAGLRDFGESRANDAVDKILTLDAEVRENSSFHFIGHLQSNKVNKVVEYFDYIHSVDSLKLASSISEAACRLNKREKVLLQVNISGEQQKFGYNRKRLLEDMPNLLGLKSIDVVGLMSMAPLNADEKFLREIFTSLRCLRDELEQVFCTKLPELSMGMSNDYHIAVEEGATIIRVGRKLFN